MSEASPVVQKLPGSYEPYDFDCGERDLDSEKQTRRRHTIIAIAVFLLSVGVIVGAVMGARYVAAHEPSGGMCQASPGLNAVLAFSIIGVYVGPVVALVSLIAIPCIQSNPPPLPLELQPVVDSKGT